MPAASALRRPRSMDPANESGRPCPWTALSAPLSSGGGDRRLVEAARGGGHRAAPHAAAAAGT